MPKSAAGVELTRSGWTSGAVRCSLGVTTCKNELLKNLGVSIDLQAHEIKSYWGMLKSDSPDLFINSAGAAYPDTDAFLKLFVSSSDSTWTHWKNPAFDKSVTEAVSEMSPEQRSSAYDSAQRILLETDVVMLPLYFRSTDYLVKPTVKHLEMTPMTSIFLRSVARTR